jgi:hypothetical protein
MIKERDLLEILGVGERIILKCVFNKWDGKTWVELMWLRIEKGGGRL